ncbi:O-succinylbenzoic acid--CoA ligase [Flavobacterium noncentrifugens]|uniref:O-succinylbenzoic acid--CoA ligase n=1 Tax=Flavobacterium noncentrifugens TaxID=1128970 RepID=A0A1G9D6Y4_9FLAO|nr:AMP-binding protein [Flavobacterium noncentrifugens]GEP52582.1 O-succinylbenzoic acid--CoA ligase [Flavobacterium noncentrifugens]SDK59637.1 O-succinylbenzoic acid--CoA ligase [Flavobacterium noncentrifugens]
MTTLNATPTYHNVHNSFKLNGFHLDKDDLCRVAYSFIKEGDDFEKPVGNFLLDWFDNNPYIDINTSGSTGTPKRIRVEKQAMVNSALATGDFFDLAPGNKALHCLPAKYIAGKMMFVRGFILGLDMDFVAPNSTPLKNNDTVYDFAAMVPLQAKHSLEELKNVKKVIIGGVYIHRTLEDALAELPTEVYETYGMTETITHIAAKRVGEQAFTVLPNVTISYDDNNCLVIHAPRISDEVIVTNDLVELVNENQFIFLGRFDNVVNSGGIKLIPEQIEEKLSGKIQSRFMFGGLPDEQLGEKLVLVLEGEERALEPHVFEELDKYERPKAILFVPKFAETETGKMMRKEILKEAAN